MVITRCTEDDYELVHRVITHPEIYPYVTDDLSPRPEDYPVMGLFQECVYILKATVGPTPIGVLVYHPWNTACYEVHTCILPEGRGKLAVQAAKGTVQWMWDNTECVKVMTQVPSFNRPAYALAYRVGLRPEGVNHKSFMKHGKLYDQHILGICKEVG